MVLFKTYSRTSNGLDMDPGTREENQLKETQTRQQGKNHPSTTCRIPPVWREGGRKCSRTRRILTAWREGGQGRLYSKPTTENTLWRGEPSSVWKGTQTLVQGRDHAKNLPRALGMAGGLTRRRQIPGMEGGNTYSSARGGSV